MARPTDTRRAKLIAMLGALIMLAGTLLVVAPRAGAVVDEGPILELGSKVTVCHRTNSVHNPYVSATVDFEASNPGSKDDHTHHLGPLFDPSTIYPTPRSDDAWGDIVPSYDANDDGDVTDEGDFEGLNWTAEGYAIWNGDCSIPQPVADLTLVKKVTGTVPDQGWSFGFTVTPEEGDPVDVTLSGSGEDTEASTDPALGLPPGDYTVSENGAGDADFVGFVCTDDNDDDAVVAQSTDATDMDAVLDGLVDGDAITCTFTNDFPGDSLDDAYLTIAKEVSPAPAEGADPQFHFTGPDEEEYDLGHGDSTDAFALTPGTYTVTEADTSAYDLKDVTCTTWNEQEQQVDFDNYSDVTDGVQVTLGEGDAVTCTFTNGPTTTTQTVPIPTPTTAPPVGSLQIVKAVTGDAPANWAFQFTGDLGTFPLTNVKPSNTGVDLPVGAYTVTESSDETAVLTDISCTGADAAVDLATRSVTVDLEADADVQCTFTNNYPEVEPDVVTTSTEPPTTQPAEVLPDVVVRPETLPRTGDNTRNMAGIGFALLAFGSVLVGASRREFLKLH